MRVGRVSLPSASNAAAAFALHATFALHVALLAPPQGLAAGPADFLAPPTWVQTDNGVMLQRMSDENTKLKDKMVKKIFDAGLKLASEGANEEEQQIDFAKLSKAEERFTTVIEDLAPNYAYGYTNRANVRVARKELDGALADYTKALELAPLAPDTWVMYLNRGSVRVLSHFAAAVAAVLPLPCCRCRAAAAVLRLLYSCICSYRIFLVASRLTPRFTHRRSPRSAVRMRRSQICKRRSSLANLTATACVSPFSAARA